MRGQRGYSLLELVVTIAVFGVFLMIVSTLSTEFRTQEKRNSVDFMRHPQVIAVLSRMRRDVLDAVKTTPDEKETMYPSSITIAGKTYTQQPDLLIVNTLVGGGVQTVVWDFRTKGEVHRISYNVGVATEWVAHGLPPEFGATVDAVNTPGHPFGVRFMANDPKGKRVLDAYFLPRAHD